METFYINNFYKTLREFLVNLRKTYPELKEDLDNYYIYIKKTKKKKFIKKFMNNLQPYAESISKNDESIFKKNEQVNILRNIDFTQIFKRSNDSNKKIIWQYLQSLFILGNFILNAGDIVKQLGSINTEKTDNSESNTEGELDEGANILKSMLDNMKNSSGSEANTNSTANTEGAAEGGSEESQENPFGFIEDLAKEIAADIKVPEGANPNNPGELLQSLLFSKDGGGFSNIISNVSEKIKNKFESGELNEEKIMKQTQSMMGNLSKQFGANMPDMSKDGAMNEENFGKMMQGMSSMLGGLGGAGGGGGGLGNLASMFGSMMGGGNDDDEMPDLDEMIKKNKKGGVDYRANLKREKLRQKLKERQTERMNKIKGLRGDKEENK